MTDDVSASWTPLSSGGVSVLTDLQESFAYEVYQDLQDYVYGKLTRPTIIFVRKEDGSVFPCFPRKRYRSFCVFCDHLREFSGIQHQLSVCVREEMNYIKDNLQLEKTGKEANWGWRKCHMGVMDYFVPIRSLTRQNNTVAVLVLGHFIFEEDDTRGEVYERVKHITSHPESHTYFPGKTESELAQYAEVLHRSITEIPVVSAAEREIIQRDLTETVALMSVIVTHTLAPVDWRRHKDFLQQLGVEELKLNVSQLELWDTIKRAANTLLKELPLSSAVVYASRYREAYHELRPTVVVPHDLRVPKQIDVPSYQDWQLLRKHGVLSLTSEDDLFQWLDPRKHFGSEAGLIFARETIAGHLLIFAFGYKKDVRLDPIQRALLNEAVSSKLLRFIDVAFFGLELDHLMGETGHLTGRAWGKVKLGFDTLNKILPPNCVASKDIMFLKSSLWAIEDGLVQLEMIHHNFYAFRYRRLNLQGDNEVPDDPDPDFDHCPVPGLTLEGPLPQEELDVIVLLNKLTPFFSRSVDERGDLRFSARLPKGEARVVGNAESLRLVFLNLFDNAVKFSYKDTTVFLLCYIQKKVCRVQFDNLGIGIPEDEFKRVFNPFTKSRYSSARLPQGVGLGLSFCKRVVEKEHKGTILINSQPARTPNRRFEGDNFRTVVTVELPLAEDK